MTWWGVGVSRVRMYAEQEGKCAICHGAILSEGPTTHIDHCHKSGRVRGLLCRSCNLGLGHFKDSIASLESAISYLRTRG